MIRIACTNCKTILLIDDAFAGGVCRCQHCGTIQTVPAKARQGNGVASGQAMGGSKATFQHGGREQNPGAGAGTGLDELAGIVASSGLAGSGLSSRRLTRPAVVPAPAGRRPSMLVVGAAAAGLLILILLGVIVWMALRPPAARPSGESGMVTPLGSGGSAETGSPAASNQPSFCGAPLDGSSVVYVLDRGSGSKEIFPALEDATLKSIQSLGTGRRFQVLFWANGSDDAGYPAASTTYATPENIEAARRTIDAVAVFGASDAKPAVQQALASHPDIIVIATPKGWQLGSDWATAMLRLRGSSNVRIDTFSLGTGGASDGLKNLATGTGGQFVQVSDEELRAAGGE